MRYPYGLAAVLKITLLLIYGSPVYALEKTDMKNYAFYAAFELRPGRWYEMEDGLKIQFLSHGHKRQAVNGPQSPLVVTMKYELSGNTSQEQHNLYPDGDRPSHWAWNRYRIHLIKYSYGESMTLIIDKVDP